MSLKKFKLQKEETVYFLILWSLCIIASLLAMPYTLFLLKNFNAANDITYQSLTLTNLGNGLLILPFPIYFGFLIRRYIFIAEIINKSMFSRKNLILGITSGIIIGVILHIMDIGFSYFIPELKDLMEKPQPGPFYGFLASFYGGIYEETLIRFFLTSLLFLLFKKLKVTGTWLAIVLASIVFAVGHLPMLTQILGLHNITDLPGLLIIRTIILNSLAGIVFGWLYWKKGLGLAILSHFLADIVIHVVAFSY